MYLTNVNLHFKISAAIAKNCRPFSGSKFIKDCMGMFVDQMCPEKKEFASKYKSFLPKNQKNNWRSF